MGILRADIVSHSQLTSANASVLFDGGDGNAGSTGLKTADSGNKYEIQSDIGELTIECWIYCTSIEQTFDTIWATNNYGVSGNSANFYQHYDGIYFTISGLGSDLDIRGLFEANKWYHVATTRKWSPSKSTHQWRIYVDGEIVGYAETGSSITEGVLCIGANNYASAFPAFEFAGYISNFRMCKRVLYKEKFTPSKFKLKDVPGTVLLCCQDASDDTAVTVGDTLTAGGSPTPGGFGPDLKEDNTDTGVVLEDNTKFDTLSYMVPPGGTTAQSNRGRCIVSNGAPGTQALQYLQMQSGGIMQSFGNLANSAALSRGCGSSTRMLVADGYISPVSTNIIEYLTIATTSNGTDYGDLTVARRRALGMSNSTRGVWVGGSDTSPTPYLNTQDYNTIATLSDATDFGDASGNAAHGGGVSSSTRGIYSLGYEAPAVVNTLEYITFATTGNAVNFGDLNHAKSYHFRGCSSSDSTRGLFAGGYNPVQDTIDYITMASTGDATDFGNLSVARRSGMATGNSIDAIFVGGYIPGVNNTIDKVTIQTTGNAVDWGDQTGTAYHEGACSSDSHGGIS